MMFPCSFCTSSFACLHCLPLLVCLLPSQLSFFSTKKAFKISIRIMVKCSQKSGVKNNGKVRWFWGNEGRQHRHRTLVSVLSCCSSSSWKRNDSKKSRKQMSERTRRWQTTTTTDDDYQDSVAAAAAAAEIVPGDESRTEQNRTSGRSNSSSHNSNASDGVGICCSKWQQIEWLAPCCYDKCA